MRRPEEHDSANAAGAVSLVRVNGIDVSLKQVVRHLGVADKLGFLGEYARRELIRQLAEREGIHPKPEDVQSDVDDWRYRHRLERVEDTEAWLRSRGITLGDVAEDAHARRSEHMMSEKVTEGRIEPYFAQHTLDFDEAEVCWIYHQDRSVIEEIGFQIREDGANFCALAREFSQDERTRPAGGFMGRLRREHLPKGIAARLFAAEPGEIFGPEKTPGGFALYLLQRSYPATLTDRVISEIRDTLFSNWLQAELQQAEICYPVRESV